jgi:hypothetical protein
MCGVNDFRHKIVTGAVLLVAAKGGTGNCWVSTLRDGPWAVKC